MIPKNLINEQLWRRANIGNNQNQWVDYDKHLLIAHTGQKPLPDLTPYYNIEDNLNLDKSKFGAVRSKIDIFDINNKLIDGNMTAHNTLDIGNATMGRALTLDTFLNSTDEPRKNHPRNH